MAMTNINIRMDKQLKDDLNEFCKEVGMNMSTLFNVFAKRVVKEQKVPFEIEGDHFYSEENMEFLRKSIQQFKEGKVVVKTLEELERMTNE